MYKTVLGSLLTLAVIALSGCETQSHREYAQMQAERAAVPTPITLQRSEPLTKALNAEFDGSKAIVLLDERHNAYVGIVPAHDYQRIYVRAPRESDEASRVRTAGELPWPVQEQIAKIVRSHDAHVDQVFVTADGKQYQRLASIQSDGVRVQSVEREKDTAASVVRDIWQNE